MLVSHHKTHTASYSDQTLNKKCNLNKTKAQPSSEKMNLPKESQDPTNLRRKISHQDPVTPSKYPRLENIIDPVDNEQFLKDIENQENQNNAFIEFSQRYGEPWRDDEQLKQLYETHMNQIKDQEIRGRRTRTYLRYLNDQQDTLINNMETVI